MIFTATITALDIGDSDVTVTVEYKDDGGQFDQFYTFKVPLSATVNTDIQNAIESTGQNYKTQFVTPPPPQFSVTAKVGDVTTI